MSGNSLIIIIQARMSSRRLPGKMLKNMHKMPLLYWVIERVKKIKHKYPIVVATSVDKSDDLIFEFCEKNNVACFRGSLENVSKRFLDCAKFYEIESFVRINGDSPLIDPRIIEKGIEKFQTLKPDMVTNVFPRSYPKGQSVEVLKLSTFSKYYKLMNKQSHFEHVTSFFYENPSYCSIYNFSNNEDFSKIQHSVDSQEDFNNIEQIIMNQGINVSYEDILY